MEALSAQDMGRGRTAWVLPDHVANFIAAEFATEIGQLKLPLAAV